MGDGQRRARHWLMPAVATVVAACTTTATSTAPTVSTTVSPEVTHDETATTSTEPPIASSPVSPPTAPPSTELPSTSGATTSSAPAPSSTTSPIAVAIDACPPTGQSIWEPRPPSTIPSPPVPSTWRTDVIGRSVRGREIVAHTRTVDAPIRRVLVVGGIHGNEPVSPPTVRGLVLAALPPDVEVVLVPELNPDGVAAGVRCNANGVDLNRNFPWGWRADDGGSAPLSEPETSAIVAFIDEVRPDVAVWVHQPYGYVSSVGPSDDTLEEAWSAGSGTPVRPDVTQHGGGESWTVLDAGYPSMLIEIDSWDDTEAIVAAHRAGFEALVERLG